MSAVVEQNREERIDSEDMRMNGMAFASGGKGRRLEHYFAREGVDPLSRAFDGKIAVHPGVGGGMVEPSAVEGSLEALLDTPRRGDSVAYIHVPFCETHCLYCGFYNRGYSREESARYTDTLIRELRLWEGRADAYSRQGRRAQVPCDIAMGGCGAPHWRCLTVRISSD